MSNVNSFSAIIDRLIIENLKIIQYFKSDGLQPDSLMAQLLSGLNREIPETVTIDSLSNIGAIDDLIQKLSTLSSGPEILECARKIIDLGKIKRLFTAYLDQRSTENDWSVMFAKNA